MYSNFHFLSFVHSRILKHAKPINIVFSFTIIGKILLSNFDAFKFPTSEVVQFRAHVTPCMPTCEPVECTNENYYGEPQSVSSYGRKKRSLATVQRQDKTLVTNSFVVMDKFQQKKKESTTSQPQYAR